MKETSIFEDMNKQEKLLTHILPTTLFCEECGITETSPSFGQQYCRYCGTKFKNKSWVYKKGDESETADESCPYRCIDCKYFDDRSYYDDNSINISACAAGSCIKCNRNLVTSDPYNQIPSWCPLKGDNK